MRWSFKVATVAGTEIKIHVTFLLLVVWIGGIYYLQGGLAAAVSGVVFILLLFACVLLHEFPILGAGGEVTGILTRDDMIKALKHGRRDAPVHEIMRRDVPTIHPDDPFERAFRLMEECGCPALPVVDRQGHPVGLITPESVGEMMMVHTSRSEGRVSEWREQHRKTAESVPSPDGFSEADPR